MNNPRLQQLIHFIISRRPSFWLGLVLGVGAVALLLHLVTTYAVLYVTVDAGQGARPILFANTSASSTRIGTPGLVVAPRAASSLTIAASDYQKTITAIHIPWYGFLQLQARVDVDKNAEKLAYNATSADPCATYDSDRETLLSYDCTRPTTLALYQTPADRTWTNRAIGTIEQPNTSVKPYLGGVLGISYVHNTEDVPPGPLFALDPTGKRRYYDAPEGLDLSNFALGTLTTDPNDPQNARFIYAAWDGTIYLGTPTGEGTQVTYITQSSPDGYNPTYERTLCSLQADRATCYQGRSRSAPWPVPTDGSGEYRREGTISTLTFAGDPVRHVKTARDVNIGEFFTTAAGQAYGQQDKTLYRFDVTETRATRQIVATNVNRTVAGDSLYFTQDDGVYEYDASTHAAYQRFYARNIIPRNLLLSAGNLFIFGSIKNAGSTLYAYRLTDADDMTPGTRLIDQLPTAFADLPGVSRLDLVGNKVLMTLKVNVSRQARSQAAAVDPQQVASLRDDALSRLQKRGVDIDALELIVRY